MVECGCARRGSDGSGYFHYRRRLILRHLETAVLGRSPIHPDGRPASLAGRERISARMLRSDSSSMGNKTVFLDRDGVINRVLFRNGSPTAPWRFAEFEIEAGVEQALKRLRHAGYKLFIVTNQPDLARGYLAADALQMMTDKLMATLDVDAIKICPHDDRDGCACRKPQPGMLLELAREYDVALADSYMIGDTWKDTMAAWAAGCKSILLDRSYNHDDPADQRVIDLNDAVELILGGSK